ncbi:Sodium/hydrogen exchanger family-domain-containing protein [Armillaria novae-zelandiae]|uniref:Sodium/hydrogen exchanger family-domain-containing protein n=1 Tax=Armillaria novae-zelandiae TaxID=153914 RepID=A0AA39PWV1_9AGAR|nr:Sodium/hydrogen exchanger family-domain-containing protein [Armillaria novae-zelandiae]
MGEFSRRTLEVARSLVGRAASGQGGVFSGDNPSEYNSNDPIRLWVIQLVIIISMTQLLALVFSRIRQPRVIAEIIGGVILGPTVMGRIPGFKNAIFPDAGMPMLNLTANIGLVLFLFLVGLEIDTRLMRRNIKAAVSVSVAGLLLPLGLGAALGVGVYREFINPSVNFGYFILFTAVAVGITAFPVLCRILTELKLLDTTVGVVTLSAGVGNDVVGWILLALTVALVNASTGLTALWVLLTSVGYVIFLMFPVKWAYVWLCKRTGSLEQGSPTTLTMTVTLLIVFISAFFTDIIGVHAIFGGFLAGLIIPHENGFAISLVEKLEDLVTILFLPLYFALSGLRTNLGLLDNGITWGYTILICVVAFTSKFLACYSAAFVNGFNWREAGAIGSLMSCKGLVELIVLNVGLQAGVLDTRTFSMFVVHAIILTFITTPLVLLFYPSRFRIRASGVRDVTKPGGGMEAGLPRKSSSDDGVRTRFAVVLDKIEQLPAMMTLSQLLQPYSTSTDTFVLSSDEKGSSLIERSPSPLPQMSIDALRLIELTNRTSAVMQSTGSESLLQSDSVVSIFRTFGRLNRMVVSAALSVIPYDEFPTAISNHVIGSDSQMVILPWSRGPGAIAISSDDDGKTGGARNPFDGVFQRSYTQDQTSSVVYSELIRKVFLSCPTDVALFVDRGMSHGPNQHLILPFFGGPDDRLALQFLVQLCVNSGVKGTVVWITKTDNALTPASTIEDDVKKPSDDAARTGAVHLTVAAADTMYGYQNTQTKLASDTADNLIWSKYTSTPLPGHTPAITSALSRITFSTQEAHEPLRAVLDLVNVGGGGTNVIVVMGRSRRMAVESHKKELAKIVAEKGGSIGSSVAKTLGDVGAALVADGARASLLVVQAAIATS